MAKKKKNGSADNQQQHFEGTHDKKQDILDAAHAMKDAERKTKSFKKKEDSARQDVKDVMEKHGLSEYEYGGTHVRIDHRDTLKVKIVGRSPEADE